jgi:diacylglycerol O-acyltransferase / wax synthase
MARLAGIDAAFLYLETPNAHMHVVGTMLLDSSTMPGGPSVARVERVVGQRLATFPRLRRRVVPIPFGLEHPLWLDDPAFDLARHVHRATLPAPGSDRQLGRTVATIASRPLDRSRPLWELWTIDGLTGGRIALVIKVHHAAIDGVSATDLMAHLFDLAPEGADRPAAPSLPAAPLPSPGELVRAALVSWKDRPRRLVRAIVDTGRAVAHLVDSALADAPAIPTPTLPFTAPRTPFSGAISAQRAVAFGRASLADVKAVKVATGATVNDVVLAACSIALRRYLAAREAVPDRALVASVPVAVDGRVTPEALNHVSAIFVGLPVHLDQPLAHLRHIQGDAQTAKRIHRALGPDLLQTWAQLAPPALLAEGARLFSRLRLAELLRPIHNLVISNVPGPPVALYAGGARLLAAYPLGPVLEGAGVNITVLSYEGTLDFGVISCRRAVPDPWRIARGFERAVADLRAAVATDARRAAGRAPTRRATGDALLGTATTPTRGAGRPPAPLV